ncbi:hypothetical protein [Streptomyces chartreusis]
MSETQIRRRRRALPPEIPEQKIRVYCPVCGHVKWGFGGHRKLFGTTVEPHWVWVPVDVPGENSNSFGEELKPKLCAGGTVDLEKDRAP